MFKKRSHIALAIAWVLFWLLMNITAVQDYLHDEHHDIWKPMLWETSSSVTLTLLLLAQRHFTSKYDPLVAQPLRWFGLQLLCLPVYWTAFVPVAFGIRHAVYALAGQIYTHTPWPETFLYEDIKITVFFSIFTAITFGVLSYHAMQTEKLRVERINNSLREAQLLRLTQQMQPHFLFNALNTISSLMHSDVHRADAMLIQLADVLRATLDVSEQHQVPLETELRLLRGYAALMSERFSDRVRIDWQVDDTLLACQVPVMSMQPLLENIFKHTVEKRRQMTGITITVRRDRDAMLMRLEDDGGALSAGAPDSGGIGVRNLRARLEAMYGAGATFDLIQLSPAGVRAEMRLPCAS